MSIMISDLEGLGVVISRLVATGGIMGLLIKTLIAIFLVFFGVYFLPEIIDGNYVDCSNGYAVQVAKGYLFQGSYVRCENFNEFYEALSINDINKARDLLLVHLP